MHLYQNWRTLHLTVPCLHDVLETTAVIAVTGESMQGVTGRYFAAGSSSSYINSVCTNIVPCSAPRGLTGRDGCCEMW